MLKGNPLVSNRFLSTKSVVFCGVPLTGRRLHMAMSCVSIRHVVTHESLGQVSM